MRPNSSQDLSDNRILRHPHRVLAVDDDPGILASYKLALSGDYALDFAEDGETALRLLGRDPIDLVILDLRLPDLHGIEILRRIRQGTPSLPVIIVTAFSSHDSAIDAANLGVAGYVQKPFDVDEIKKKIECVLSRSAITRTDAELPSGQKRVADLALGVIRTRYAEKLTAKMIAKTVGVSPRQLRDAFQEQWGLSVKDYLIRVRIENARTLLRQTDLPIKAIAAAVGYQGLSHFYKHFLRLTGETPCAYRRSAAG